MMIIIVVVEGGGEQEVEGEGGDQKLIWQKWGKGDWLAQNIHGVMIFLRWKSMLE